MKKVKTGADMARALEASWKDIEDDFSSLYVTSVIDTRSNLRIFTPKDTEWASKHWSIGRNRSTEDESVTLDDIKGIGAGDNVSIYNNVPYIGVLDEGHSMQRPTGFTHIVLQMALTKLQQAINKFNVKVVKDV